jgi:hypothetical protein
MVTFRWIERASPERASRPDALIRIDALRLALVPASNRGDKSG